MAILNPGIMRKKLARKRAHQEGTKEYEKMREEKKARIEASRKHNSTQKKGDDTFYKTLMKAFESKPKEEEKGGEEDAESEGE